MVSKDDQCKICKGQRVVEEEKVLEVTIVKGMRFGERLVFSGEADQLPDTIPGDVIVVLVEKPPESEDYPWKRMDDDLLYKQTISLKEALTGYEFEIRHLDGRILLVKSEPRDVIKPGDLRVIVGEGMPRYKNISEKGKLFIKFDIEFPTYAEISPHLKQLKECLPGPAEGEKRRKVDTKKADAKKGKKKKDKKEDSMEDEPIVVVARQFDVSAENERRRKEKQRREEEEGSQEGTCVQQ